MSSFLSAPSLSVCSGHRLVCQARNHVHELEDEFGWRLLAAVRGDAHKRPRLTLGHGLLHVEERAWREDSGCLLGKHCERRQVASEALVVGHPEEHRLGRHGRVTPQHARVDSALGDGALRRRHEKATRRATSRVEFHHLLSAAAAAPQLPWPCSSLLAACGGAVLQPRERHRDVRHQRWTGVRLLACARAEERLVDEAVRWGREEPQREHVCALQLGRLGGRALDELLEGRAGRFTVAAHVGPATALHLPPLGACLLLPALRVHADVLEPVGERPAVRIASAVVEPFQLAHDRALVALAFGHRQQLRVLVDAEQLVQLARLQVDRPAEAHTRVRSVRVLVEPPRRQPHGRCQRLGKRRRHVGSCFRGRLCPGLGLAHGHSQAPAMSRVLHQPHAAARAQQREHVHRLGQVEAGGLPHEGEDFLA
mmetsp:Transcript_22380/g.66065  ORF Transcript_22380/g.66065 Transcript_22380/m.66065 type:complete len:425 (+) Transcript_22380:72-1346(+)